MARKAKQVTAATAVAPKKRARAVVTERTDLREEVQATTSGNQNRLLREAAWSRMFGRVESKNPFTR